MTNVGFASISIIPSFDGFQGKLERGVNPGLTNAGRRGGARFGDIAGRSAGARFGSVFKTAAKATLIGAAGAAALAVKFGSDAIGSASDLNESLNAVNVTYGKQARAVKRLGRQSAEALGLSNNEFNSLSVRFSAFTKTIAGSNGKKIVRTLDDLSTRASDFASVMNLEVNEAAELFQSGLAGESEPLRKFGIDLSAASVEAFAYANGIAETGSKLTEAQKVQARYGSIMEQTAKTQGDFKNTSGELANQQRILSARWEDGKAKLGKGLLPIMSDAADFLLDEGIPAFEDFSDWFTTHGIPAIKDLGKKLRPLADELLPAARDGFKGIRNFAEDALPFAEGIVKSFNDMPDWVKKVLIGGAAGGLAAKKLGLGGVGSKVAGGLLAKGGSPANPLYVFTVNGGADTPGGGKSKFGFLGALGASALIAGVAGGVTAGVSKALGPGNQGLLGAGSGGSGSVGGPTGNFFSGLNEDNGNGPAKATAKVKELNAALRLTQLHFFDTKKEAQNYTSFVNTRLPTEASIKILGWDEPIADAERLLALIGQIQRARTDNFIEGHSPDPPPPPPRGGNQRGVNINIGTVQAHDYKDFTTQIQRRSVQAASDGWGGN